MAQAAVADVAAEETDQTAGRIAQKAIEFLDQDVISWSRQKTTIKISENGRREVEETTKWSVGVKVWELGVALAAITVWEAIQIFKGDLSQSQVSGDWIEQALLDIGFGLPGELLGSEIPHDKKLPKMPSMSAMGVLDAQLGVMFAQILGPINLSGGQVVNGLIAGLAKKGGVVKSD